MPKTIRPNDAHRKGQVVGLARRSIDSRANRLPHLDLSEIDLITLDPTAISNRNSALRDVFVKHAHLINPDISIGIVNFLFGLNRPYGYQAGRSQRSEPFNLYIWLSINIRPCEPYLPGRVVSNLGATAVVNRSHDKLTQDIRVSGEHL